MIQNNIVVLNSAYSEDSSDSDTDQQYLIQNKSTPPEYANPVITLWKPFIKPTQPQPKQNQFFKMTTNIKSPTTSTNKDISSDDNSNKENKEFIIDEENIVDKDSNNNNNNNNNNKEKLPIYKRIFNEIKSFKISTWIKIGIFIIVLTAILVAILKYDVQNSIFDFLETLQNFVAEHDHGKVIGGFIYMAVFTLLIIFLIPVTIPTIIGGIIFRFWWTLLFVWSASMVGGSISFLLGRFVFRKRIRNWISTRPKMKAIDDAIGKESWKLVLLLRLTPIVPESILNYALSVAPLTYTKYAICSSIGLIPGTSFFIYMGTLFNSVENFKEKGLKMGKSDIVIYCISGVLMIVNIVFISVIVKRAVNKKLDQQIKQSEKENNENENENQNQNENENENENENDENENSLLINKKEKEIQNNNNNNNNQKQEIKININDNNNNVNNNSYSNSSSSSTNNNFEDYEEDEDDNESSSLLGGGINNSDYIEENKININNNDNYISSSFKKLMLWFTPNKKPILVN